MMLRHARWLSLPALAAAGVWAAALVTAPAANAWNWQSLPSGYSVSTQSGVPGCGGVVVSVNGRQIGCSTDPGFQSSLDAYVNATICSVNPAAGGSQCAPTTSSTTTPTTTVTSTSAQATSTATTTTAAPVGGAAPATSTSTASTTTPSTTTTATTTTVASGPPTAAFTSAATGLSVAFTDVSQAVAPATIKTVSWQFGDGGTAVGASATHVYTLPGTFTVIEIVTDTGGLTDQATVALTLTAFGGTRTFAERVSAPLTKAAAALGPVKVFCVSSWGAAKPENGGGLSILGSGQANVSAADCAALARGRGRVALALLVVGHETAHALGIRSERTADCYALKRVPLVEKRLKLRDRGWRAQAAAIVKKRWGKSCWG